MTRKRAAVRLRPKGWLDVYKILLPLAFRLNPTRSHLANKFDFNLCGKVAEETSMGCFGRYLLFLRSLAILVFAAGCSINSQIHDSRSLEPRWSSLSQSTNSAPIRLPVVFNREVSKVVPAAVSLKNAKLAKIDKVSAQEYVLYLQPLQEGVIEVELKEGFGQDWGGLNSTRSEKIFLDYDVTAPPISQALLALTSPHFSVRPPVNVVAEAHAELILFDQGSCTGNILAQGAGAESSPTVLIPSAFSAEGSYTLSVLARDSAGNTSCHSPIPYELDFTPPFLALLTPAAMDRFAGSATLTGICEAGLDVHISGEGVAAPFSAPCPAGTFIIPVPFSSGDGSKTINLQQTDAAQNNQSVSIALLNDSTPPVFTTAPASFQTLRDQTLTTTDAAIQTNEEGAGVYSLLAASAPACSSYGTVVIDEDTGALVFTPQTNYYNRHQGQDFHGGPCNVLIQFADKVTPAPHVVTHSLKIEVDWENGTNNAPLISAWPGSNGTAIENCGEKCYANTTFDLSFTASPGGGAFPDPQNLTCSATTGDSYYVDVVSCAVNGSNGVLSLMMGLAHAHTADTTPITLTVSDGVHTISQSFVVNVSDYVVNFYPALATRASLSCLVCHANIQADVVTDFNVSKADYANASNILGVTGLNNSHIYHQHNDTVPFSITGSLIMPPITITDPNFIKQVTGSAHSGSFNLKNFLENPFTMHFPLMPNGAYVTDPDGTITLSGTTAAKDAVFPSSRVSGGLVEKTSVTIRAPSQAEVLALAPALSASHTGFVYQGPNAKPSLSGLEVFTYGNYGDGDHKFVRNNGPIVCHGTIVVSGPLYLKNPDIQTDDVGCSIYVAGHVFIESNRANALHFVGGATSPTLQIAASGSVHMGLNLYSILYTRGTGGYHQAARIANDANPGGLIDAAGLATTIKSNANAGALEYQTCPLDPTEANYLDAHYLSDGNYEACKTGHPCSYAERVFNGWTGPVVGYSHESPIRTIYNGSSLISNLRAYETLCRRNSGWQMSGYTSYGWEWSGHWGEDQSRPGAAAINALRHSTRFDHLRVNGNNIHSRYYGVFNGSVISPYSLFAIGNLVFTYDNRLDNVVPYSKMMGTNPLFKVED